METQARQAIRGMCAACWEPNFNMPQAMYAQHGIEQDTDVCASHLPKWRLMTGEGLAEHRLFHPTCCSLWIPMSRPHAHPPFPQPDSESTY
eukprot:2764362-Amphidinium_carterae.1